MKLKFKKLKIKNKKLILIPTILFLLIFSTTMYIFFPLKKSYDFEIENKNEWIMYVEDVSTWCTPKPPRIYIYENGNYIYKISKNGEEYIEQSKGKIKTTISTTRISNNIKNNNDNKNNIKYHIKYNDGTEKNITLTNNIHLTHYINKIPDINMIPC